MMDEMALGPDGTAAVAFDGQDGGQDGGQGLGKGEGVGQTLLTQAEQGLPQAEAIRDAAAYQDFSLPDGAQADPQAMDSFRMVAAEHGLSQQAAQSLLDLHLQTLTSQGQAQVAAVQQWAEDARADREFGGVGFDANMGIARKALQAYGSPQLAQVLTQSGLGNHPDVIRTFYRIGKTLSEDRRVGGGQSTQSDRLNAMYPSMVRR
jgi:hypothetical protein